MDPHTGSQLTGFFKDILDILDGQFALGCDHRLRQEVIPVVVNHNPAGSQHAQLGIAVCFDTLIQEQAGILALAGAVFAKVIVELVGSIRCGYLLNTGQLLAIDIVSISDPAGQCNAVNIGNALIDAIEQLAAGFHSTLSHTVHQRIAVAIGGNGGAPFHGGVTACAEGAADVAGFGAGCSLVCQSFRGMGMCLPACMVCRILGKHIGIFCPGFRVRKDTVTGEGGRRSIHAVQHAALQVCDHGDPPEFLHGDKLLHGECILTLLGTVLIFIAGYQAPDPNRNGCQNSFAGSIRILRTGKADVSMVFVGIHLVGSREALGHLHMGQGPGAQAVQVDGDLCRLHFFDGSCHQIHVVNRIEGNPIQSCVMGHQLDGAFALLCRDSDLTDLRGIVTHLVADGELNSMDTVGQLSAGNGHNAAGDGAANFHAVNVCLCGTFIQARVIGLGGVLMHNGAEAQHIACGNLIVQFHSIGHCLIGVPDACKDRCFAIIHCGRIVHSDVINVEVEIAGNVAVIGSIVAISAAISVRDVELHDDAAFRPAHCLVCRSVDVQIMPAGLIELDGGAGTAGGGINGIAVNACCTGGCTIFVKSGVTGQRPARPQADSLLRDVDPHTNANRIFKQCSRACQQAGLLVAGFHGVAVVDRGLHGVIAAVNSAVCSRDNLLAA